MEGKEEREGKDVIEIIFDYYLNYLTYYVPFMPK